MKRLIFYLGVTQVLFGLGFGMEVEKKETLELSRIRQEFDGFKAVVKKYEGYEKLYFGVTKKPITQSSLKFLKEIQSKISKEKESINVTFSEDYEQKFALRRLNALQKNFAAIQKTAKIFETLDSLEFTNITKEDVEECDPLVRFSDNSTVLSKFVCFTDFNNYLENLIERSNLNQEDCNGFTPLHNAVCKNNKAAVIKFLKYYAGLRYENRKTDFNVNTVFDIQKILPNNLFIGDYCDAESLRLLSESGFFSSEEPFQDFIDQKLLNLPYNPYELLYSIEEGQLSEAKNILEQYSSSKNTLLPSGYYPLEHAFVTKNSELTNYLLNGGSNINKKNLYGFSPFFAMAVFEESSVDFVKSLVEEYKANIDQEYIFADSSYVQVTDNPLGYLKLYETTATLLGVLVDLPETRRVNQVIQYLLSKKARYLRNMETNPILRLVTYSRADFLETILKTNQFDVNALFDEENTALFKACWAQDYKIAELLLQYGADPDIVCFGELTARELAKVNNDTALKNLFKKYKK